jgi:hypothetical protein
MNNDYKKPKIDLDEYKIIIDIQEWLDEVGTQNKKSGTSELILEKCPNCGKSRKMYMNVNTGRYNCFSCGPKDPSIGKGNIIRFAMRFHNMTYDEALKKFYGIELKNEKASLDSLKEDLGFGNKKRKLEQVVAYEIQIPLFFQPLDKTRHPEAWKYLLGRGIKEEIIPQLGSFYAIYGKDEVDEKTKEIIINKVPRIINVVYKNGKPMGFVARDITNKAEKKVLNSTGKFRTVSIWNMDKAQESDELIICEGIFSAIQCGINRSIALLGKTATEQQLDLIRNSKAKKIYFCLDAETDSAQDKLHKELALYFPMSIYKIIMPEVIKLKVPLSEELKNKICLVYGIKINFENDKEILMKSTDKKKLKLLFESKKDKFTEDEFKSVEWLAKKAEYKDAGDYSEEEMDLKIKNAVVYKKKGLLS